MEYPQEFVVRMTSLPGLSWEQFTAAQEQPLRRGLRVNTAKIAVEAFCKRFYFPLTPSPFAADCFYVDGDLKAGSDPLHHAGAYYMQEPSAATAVTVLNPRLGEKILDLCAAPGGKSTQIATALGDTGLLWSNEYVAARARVLHQNLERWGIRRRVISHSNTDRLCAGLTGYFDGVLVDAPCSGEGMFRKEPQALENWSIDNIRLCAARQTEILENAALAVKPGGRLVYSTCTFAPEENEAVIARFLNEHDDFSLVPITVDWGQPGFSFADIRGFTDLAECAADLTGCRRVFPQHGGEGHFIALLHRDTSAVSNAPAPYIPPTRDARREAAAALYADCFTAPPVGEFVTCGEQVQLLPPELPRLTGLGVIAAGIATAQICKDRLEPHHEAFMATPAADCRRVLTLSPDDGRLTAFLRGEELRCDAENGWTAIATAGMTLGFGKCAGGRLKNRYPKGLRLL